MQYSREICQRWGFRRRGIIKHYGSAPVIAFYEGEIGAGDAALLAINLNCRMLLSGEARLSIQHLAS